MSRRDLLIWALSIIKDECHRHGSCNNCPFYDAKENTGCGIKRDSPENWYVPDYDDEDVEPIGL